ncbi:reverse transcriptase family protein [Nocardia mangyaensis]|uniref:reverse transcriptase family protein n=1 Tax=Nocardia mangyaensis TaxID=2213200 RepID=UPI002676658F|nr:reverse transcriptase family protein [Nocardia mangyaensis]MDO3645697.1 reverse transcriptase family protein [Nocardia mangyaensis]
MQRSTVDEGFWSLHHRRIFMSRMISVELAAELARAFELLDDEWAQARLAEAFGEVIEPGLAESIARRVIDLMPVEPIDPVETLRRLLAELPKLPMTVVPLDPPEVRMRFGAVEIPDLAALAVLLNVTPSELEWFADRGGWLRRSTQPLSHYRYRRLSKASGERLVEAPKVRLREIQRRILHKVLTGIPADPACHGFERGRSAATFGAPHAGAPVVVRMDLRDFFPTIGLARVRAVFAACGYSPAVARVLAELCTTASPVAELRGLDHAQRTLLAVAHLPQGAPTSPRLANLVARGLDRRLTGYANRHDLTYTRYADDLALSGNANTAHLVWTVTRIAEDEGFTVHPAKTRIRRAHQRQILAGLVVNAHPTAPRDRYDAVRALLHNCLRTGANAQNLYGHNDFRAHVYGLISWIGETSPHRRDKLLTMADRVDWTR